MCGRYASVRSRQQLMQLFAAEKTDSDEPLREDYNVAPTKRAPAVLAKVPDGEPKDADPVRELRVLRWGLIPSWAKDRKKAFNNARAETVHEKPSFKRAFTARRCLIPIEGFYEWFPVEGEEGAKKPIKQPYFLHPNDGGVLAAAAIYEYWRDPEMADDDPELWVPRFTILTTQATDDVGHIHDRMPMVVTPDNWETWLDPRLSDVEQIRSLMAPPVKGSLEIYPVSTLVNVVRNNGRQLIERV